MKLSCPWCGVEFSLRVRVLRTGRELWCPLCGRKADVWTFLADEERKEVMKRVSDVVEKELIEGGSGSGKK